MLLISAAYRSSTKTIRITHEVVNSGKATEEHIIRLYEQPADGTSLAGAPLASYVLNANAARELKAHL
jgi:hypothetical protein